MNQQIEEIAYSIDEMKPQNGERWTVKQMEAQKKKLEEQLKSLADESRKDDLITFEELGVDSIMVDEAHNVSLVQSGRCDCRDGFIRC